MKLKFAALVTAGVGIWALSAGSAWPDTLVVNGRRSESRSGFLVVGDEVYAPLLDSLTYLHAEHRLSADTIAITTATDREILISRKRPEATRDGVLREMPGLPQEQGGAILLPARAVGSLLGCAVRWDQAARILYLHPWVRKFSLDTLPDRYRLTVAAESPITYRTGELANPPRLFIDLLNADLSQIPTAFAVQNSYLKSVRIHQKSLAPQAQGDVARIVVEMTEPQQSRISESANRCEIYVDFPLPGAAELPPEAPPVILTGLGFTRTSARLAEVRLSVYGTPYCTSVDMYDPTKIAVDIFNAQNQLRGQSIELADRLVEEVSVVPALARPGAQRLLIALRQPTGHSIEVTEGEVRVLLGQLDLAELKVVIDAGHGGQDTGAIGRRGLQEKDVNLDIAERTAQRLREMGVSVCLTRADADSVRPWTRGNREEQRAELLTRCTIANELPADLFVSIHANAHRGNPMERRGTETYYRKADSLDFARVMQREVVKALGLPDGGVIRHPKSIIVLSYTDMPAVLVETGYLSHPADEALLGTDECRERTAQGIVNGIKSYAQEGGLLRELARRERARPRAAETPPVSPREDLPATPPQ